ncbi:carbohydrate ABC transporter substrate-binding protein (CUT1 family) [Micromonospora sp. M71_S20]|uniref:extracellular solute-binding protein n=1 Tax=Micromonospora sp. M71_S20 TaxID=592872 RepID=UPI000EB2FE16|nr:extracellular solute-binding protein [Micromonospora sp. M71_S20]RLK09659.1 carbohydrate ABC transporter substrate-binding protein (CUT1 family) [Micromonospora sp. M71_S20]
MAAAPPKIKINVWLTDPTKWATNAQDVALSAAASFTEKHPEYHVDITRFDFRMMPSEVARATEQGALPDIVEYHDAVTRLALDTLGPDGSPLYTPIERAIAGRSEILGEPVVLGDMVPTVREYFRYAGELMSVPRTASTMVLYANMDLLAKAGVAEPPRTWREVTAACQAIRKMAGGPTHGITWPNFYWPFLQAVAQQGGLIADHDNGRSGRPETTNLASSEMMAFVAWWQGLHRDGHYLYTDEPGDFPGCFAAFENQQVALLLTSSVDASHLLQRGERQGFTVGVGPLPYNDEVPLAGNVLGGFSLWLTAGLDSAKRDGALAFMQHLNSPRNVADWAKHHYRIPITRAAVDVLDQEGWYRRHPHLRVAGDQLEAADGSPAALGPLLGGHAEIMGELTGAMHDVLSGAEPEARFRQANARAQQILDAYNAYCDGPPRRSPDLLAVST